VLKRFNILNCNLATISFEIG